ncbi:hypothetical protein DIZ27_08040 [Streptomyces sp. NWU339]|uniref:RraA family protein n=1 Tax=Streptomyces sp. NWU339 TaxID=2185284 RepID=UPI000D682303|nr:hypothetical protein [Streptomyces sp. NWU339]PWI11314.1 hypothetical protein DIZ27_08040 [Streptomyces sp. NWU339]
MKEKFGALGEPARVGGVLVHPGDIVVADEEGIVLVPAAREEEILAAARSRLAKAAEESLDTWEANHRARTEKTLTAQGFNG